MIDGSNQPNPGSPDEGTSGSSSSSKKRPSDNPFGGLPTLGSTPGMTDDPASGIGSGLHGSGSPPSGAPIDTTASSSSSAESSLLGGTSFGQSFASRDSGTPPADVGQHSHGGSQPFAPGSSTPLHSQFDEILGTKSPLNSGQSAASNAPPVTPASPILGDSIPASGHSARVAPASPDGNLGNDDSIPTTASAGSSQADLLLGSSQIPASEESTAQTSSPPINPGPPPIPGGPIGSRLKPTGTGTSLQPPSSERDQSSAGSGFSSAIPGAIPGANGGTSTSGSGFKGTSHQAELYAELFGVAPQPRITNGPAVEKRSNALNQVHAPAPTSPRTLEESGLTLSQVCDLILKQLYLHGSLLGVEIARSGRLPFNVIDECLRFLKDDHAIEVTSGDVIGRASYRFNLTELGRSRAREAFEFCRYVGPAPVTLEVYVEQCRRQAVSGINCTADALMEGFSDLIIQPDLLEQLGPAVCTGRSIFLYGPPGNGKSQIAKGLGRFLNAHGGDIYVPYAIQSENSIITVFDPSLHQTTDDEEVRAMLGEAPTQKQGASQDFSRLFHESHPDLRWRRIRRPVAVVGGELTLDQLDLRYNQNSNFYVAPLQMKANGGVFMIDDFGRQIVSPKDLLNRWILPLEERIDYVTLATGKKFPVPFEELIIFSTNLDPEDLVDDAFLRRIRHKIKIDTPARELYTEIFSLVCELNKIPYEPRAVEYLYNNYYDHGRPPRSSDPRDLLEIVQSICRFRNQRLVLTQELMSEATQRFFSKL